MQRRGILVVDDSAETLGLLTDILAAEGYEVRPANDGELALASAAAEPPELILLDIRMPGLGGFEVFRRLRARQESRNIPVILLSTTTALEDRVEGMALGAIDFILKPFHRDELLARVRTHLELIRHRSSPQTRTDERTGALRVDYDALRESEEHFRTLVEFSSDWVWVTDPTGRYTYSSPKAKDLLGYDAREILGKRPFDFMPKDEAERVSKAFADIVQTRGPFAGLENTNVRKDGRLVVLETSGVPIIDERNVLRGYRGIDRDITERKRAEEALRGSETRYRTLLHSIPQKVFYKDRNSVYVAVNASYARDFLISPDAFVGKSDFDFYPRDLAEKYRRDDRRIMDSGATDEFDESYVYEGEKRTVHTLKTAVRDDRGAVVGVLGIFWDITERKRAEDKLEQLTQNLRAINEQLVVAGIRAEDLADEAERRAGEFKTVIESMVDAVYATDAEGRITLTNQAGVRMLGLSTIDEVLRPVSEFPELLNVRHQDGTPVAPDEQPLLRALSGQIVVNQELVLFNPITARDTYLRINAAPIRSGDRQIVGAVAVARDITELIELDELKDQFILVAAHELKTPVAIMKGYAQALQRTPEKLPEPRRKMLDAISRGADRINGIAQNLVDISRIHLGELDLLREKIDLSELVEGVVNRLALSTNRHQIRLVQEVPVIVQGDRERLELVLGNLIDNAMRYSPNGGPIELAMAKQDHEAVVSIADHGVGIPRQKQRNIFGRFYRAHTGTPYDFGGMGVGLYISREVIRRHGGRMWFESEEGKGSTFCFSLPLDGE